jgi:hypothetical protein
VNLLDKLILIFLGELIFGGPLGTIFLEISIRKLLILMIFFCSIIVLFRDGLLKKLHINLIVLLITYMLIWGLFIPYLNDINLNYALKEIYPLTCLFLIIPFIQVFNYYGAHRYLDFISYLMSILSIIIIITWCTASYYDSQEYAFALKSFYQKISGSSDHLYIGPMPDGSFRVMWITCMILPFLIIYKNINSIKVGWTILFIISVYASGTRAFFYSSLIIVMTMLILKLKKKIFPVLALILITGIFLVKEFAVDTRIFQVKSEFDLDSPRAEQFLSLMRLFYEYPIMGAGFGATGDILRSDMAPYSYELTYVSLFAKTGFIGISIILILSLIFFFNNFKKFSSNKIILSLIFSSFLFITSTNPYLLNIFGVTFLSFLIALNNYYKNKLIGDYV